jgi:hypothetical protein
MKHDDLETGSHDEEREVTDSNTPVSAKKLESAEPPSTPADCARWIKEKCETLDDLLERARRCAVSAERLKACGGDTQELIRFLKCKKSWFSKHQRVGSNDGLLELVRDLKLKPNLTLFHALLSVPDDRRREAITNLTDSGTLTVKGIESWRRLNGFSHAGTSKSAVSIATAGTVASLVIPSELTNDALESINHMLAKLERAGVKITVQGPSDP